MDIIRIFQVLARRWAVAVPVVLVGLAIAGYAYVSIPDKYTVEGKLRVTQKDAGANQVTPALVAQAVQDAEVKARVKSASGGAEPVYVVTPGSESILTVQATAANATNAVAVVNAVLAEIEPTVKARLGDDAPEGTLVDTLNRPSVDAVVSVDPRSRLVRAEGSVRLLGLGTDSGMKAGTVMNILAASLSSDATVDEVVAQGGSKVYEVTLPERAPAMVVSIAAEDPAVATKTAQILEELANPKMKEILADSGIKTTNFHVTKFGDFSDPQKDSSGLLKSVVALVVVTFALGAAVAYAAEAIAEYRAGGRGGAAGAAGSPRTTSIPTVPAGNNGAPRPNRAPTSRRPGTPQRRVPNMPSGNGNGAPSKAPIRRVGTRPSGGESASRADRS